MRTLENMLEVAVAAVEWLDMARIVRTQTLSLKSRDFVRAAYALGFVDLIEQGAHHRAHLDLAH